MTDAQAWANPPSDGGPDLIEAGEALLRLEREERQWVFAVDGEIDLANAETLDRELRRAINEAPKVILDLSGLRFIDSTGIKSLVVATREARSAECDLGVLRPPPDVQRTFAITGIEATLRFLD